VAEANTPPGFTFARSCSAILPLNSVGDRINRLKSVHGVHVVERYDLVSAEALSRRQLLLQHARDDSGSPVFGCEGSRAAHAAERAGNEHSLPWLDLCRVRDELVACGRHERQCRRFNKVQVVREFGQELRLDGAELGVCMVGSGGHPIAYGETERARPDLNDGP
jgi:hypothetical protein